MHALMAPQYSFVRAAVLGLVSAFALFWMLHLMIVGHGKGFNKSENLPTIDFVRLKRDSELETRIRQKPVKPPPPKDPPPPPKMQIAKMDPTQQAPLPFKIPNLNLGVNLGGGPFIGNFVAADAGAYSDLIPLVALAPQYPRAAARDGIEGWVDVEITVGSDGNVKAARATNAKPRGVFESAAVSAALKSRFRPKMVDGKPQEQKGIRRYNFTLGQE